MFTSWNRRLLAPAVMACAVVALSISVQAAPVAGACTHPQGGIDRPFLGDVNGTGAVNVADALCCIVTTLELAGGGTLASVGCLAADGIAADVSCDGTIDITDIQNAVRLALGLPVADALSPREDGCPLACEDCRSGGGSCLIAGACETEGMRSGADGCLICDPASDAADWTPQTPTTYYLDADADADADADDYGDSDLSS